LIRSTLCENSLKPTGAVLIGFGRVGQPQRFPVSCETPPFAGFSGWARWKGPDARKGCSLLALWVQVIGAMAELERSLIVERVRAGLRNPRAKGKRLGRPRVIVDREMIAALRAEGLSWAKIAAKLNIGEG
jgi:hypothetical protein